MLIDGITVAQGDLVIGDDSGVAFIPRQRASEVINRAEQFLARESAIAADIRAGIPINRAMDDARLAGQTTPKGDADAANDDRMVIDRLAVLPTASDLRCPRQAGIARFGARYSAAVAGTPGVRAGLHCGL